ncbi:aromatic ring-hydroxylating dioxygenase subunit alpha [Terrarubrum flagellatum]|uniref:aromatic ring-hydroxylating oxygenase subunit alpha n=1 Tax=Terrirubrum flagellatum TaxID=2895980 RepID=UPI003144E20D
MDVEEIRRIEGGALYEAARTAPPDQFPHMPDIPGGRYVDPDFFALEMRGMWKRSWVYAIHGDEVPKPGSFLRWERLGEPLFFVRDETGRVRCFYNTCRHRGAPVVTTDTGEARGLSCKYHGWTYNLRGELINLRDKRDFVELDMSCRSLIEVRCENLGNWHFINLDKNAEPLADALGETYAALKEMQPENLILVDKTTIKVGCNVKVLLDAFLEVYHLKSIHQNTVDRFLDHRGSLITLYDKGHSRMVTPFKRKGWQDPGIVGLPLIPTADPYLGETNLSLNIYPNIVSPLAPAGAPFLCFWPDDIRSMTIEVHWFAPSWGEGERPPVWDVRLSNFLKILDEDLQFADAIQKSVESSGFTGMPLNYQERRIYHWHQELDRRIGRDRIDPALRVEPVLESYAQPTHAPPTEMAS